MKFRIEITKVTAARNEFLKLRLLSNEIGLIEEEATAAAVGATWYTFESVALCQKVVIRRPKASLFDYGLHALEPSRHGWVIVWIIEVLSCTIE